jgi:hypothetical protein
MRPGSLPAIRTGPVFHLRNSPSLPPFTPGRRFAEHLAPACAASPHAPLNRRRVALFRNRPWLPALHIGLAFYLNHSPAWRPPGNPNP